PVPVALRVEPADGHRRRLSIVARVRDRARLAGRGHFRDAHAGAVHGGVRHVQADGQVFRGRYLMPSLAIQLDNVTKKYRTGRSRTLVDLVASNVDRLRGKNDDVHSAARG